MSWSPTTIDVAARPRAERSAARPAPRRGAATMVLAAMTFGPLPLWLPAESEIPTGARMLSAAAWLVCLWPSWAYLLADGSRRRPLPLLPMIALAHGVYYALQGVVGSANTNDIAVLDPSRDYDVATREVLLGCCMLLLGYAIPRFSLARRARMRLPAVVTPSVQRWALPVIYAGPAVMAIHAVRRLPGPITGIATFLDALSLAAIALLMTEMVRGRLAQGLRGAMFAGIGLAVFVRLAGGAVAASTNLAIVLFVAVWLAGRGLSLRWVVTGAVVLAMLVSVKGILGDYRRIAWQGERNLSLVQRAGLTVALVKAKSDEIGPLETVFFGWDKIANRSANLDLFADVIRRTPDVVPYWNGQTYVSLVGVAIPRFLWPSKPVKNLGQDFGHRYGYILPSDLRTSINFPYLIEFYANFGEIGVAIGMFIVGAILKAFDDTLNRPKQSLLVSVVGLAMGVSLLNVESDFSLVFGGLMLNGIAFAIVLHQTVKLARHALPPRASSTPQALRPDSGR